MTPSGPVPHLENPINIPGYSRKTIGVNDYLADTDFSTSVTGESAIVAERAMYWATAPGARDTLNRDRLRP